MHTWLFHILSMYNKTVVVFVFDSPEIDDDIFWGFLLVFLGVNYQIVDVTPGN